MTWRPERANLFLGAVLAATLGVVACNGRDFMVGSACLPGTLPAGEAVSFEVYDECAGSIEFKGLRCEVEVAGSTITIRTPSRRHRDTSKQDSCGMRSLTCTLPALPEGNYEVAFTAGSAWRQPLVVSGAEGTEALCVGSHYYPACEACHRPSEAEETDGSVDAAASAR